LHIECAYREIEAGPLVRGGPLRPIPSYVEVLELDVEREVGLERQRCR
jgi:hypothetical protein